MCARLESAPFSTNEASRPSARSNTNVFADAGRIYARNSAWQAPLLLRPPSPGQRASLSATSSRGAIIRKSRVFVIGIVTSGAERVEECTLGPTEGTHIPRERERETLFRSFSTNFLVFLFIARTSRPGRSSRRESIREGIPPVASPIPWSRSDRYRESIHKLR